MSETIVVAGATGYLGRYVVRALDEAGFRVRALVRSRSGAEEPGRFGSPSLRGLVAEWGLVDYGDPGTLREVCSGADRVVSCLGVTRQAASPWDVDFLGNLRLLGEAEQRDVRSFLYVNVLHAERGASLTMRSKYAFSQVLTRSAVAGQIVNPSGYFSDMTDFYLLARKGVGFTVGSGAARVNPIHGADLADFVVERMRGPAGIWDVGGPETFSFREIEELAFRIAGRRSRVLRLGPAAVRPTLWAADRGSPRWGNLARFFLESLGEEGVGVPYGTRTLESFLRSVGS
jgi:uncharacterized protein YbjT (DUF2867 family)